jgi:hypothetical protein
VPRGNPSQNHSWPRHGFAMGELLKRHENVPRSSKARKQNLPPGEKRALVPLHNPSLSPPPVVPSGDKSRPKRHGSRKLLGTA